MNLTATDMDISIVESAESSAATPGATTAPAHTFYDIVRKLPDGAQIELDASGDSDRLSLTAGRSRFTLATLPTADFPTMSAGELPHTFAVPADDLRSLVDRTRFAISTEETRYYLNGIYLHAIEVDSVSVLRAVATDGHRWRAWRCRCRTGRPACRASSFRADHQRVAKAYRRMWKRCSDFLVRHENPLRVRWHGPDIEADRRYLSRLRKSHSGQQR